jgi:hypothetical protein
MLWQQKEFTNLVKGAKAPNGTYFACYLGGLVPWFS